MTITKMLLDEHGARFAIESEPGEGTRVTVTLLVDPADSGATTT
jgi:signal transduction histidine kinase